MAGQEKGKLPAISEAEWEVMKAFWDHGEMAARDVYEALPDGRDWSYRTVKTLLSRLVAKGALEYDQIGNSYLYRAAVPRDQMTRKEVRGFLDRVFDGSAAPVIAHFIEQEEISEEEAQRLRDILDSKNRKRGGKRGGS